MKTKKLNDEEIEAARQEAIRMAQIDFSSVRSTIIESIMRMFTDAYERIKISMILPSLLNDRTMVVKVLTGTKYEHAIKLLDDFIRRRDIILRERRPPLMDVGMVRIMDFFQRNSEIYTLFPVLINKMKLNEQKLLKTFEKLMDVVQTHLLRNSMEHIQQERYLQKVFKEQQELSVAIKKFEDQIAQYEAKQETKQLAKESYLAGIREAQRLRKERTDEKIARETERFRRVAASDTKKSLFKQLELIEKLEAVRFQDAKFRKERAKGEKEGREETNKLVIQLQAIIKKYDTQMLERFIENLHLTDELKIAQKNLRAFMVLYRQEEVVYKEIVEKREKEEWKKKQATIMNYMMNRAARRIQKYWRAWRKHMARKNRRKK